MGVLLHVEDEDAVASIFRAALDAARLRITVCRVSNGEEALEYLRTISPTAERPDAVFLDLNMPKMDGWEVLAQMQADPKPPLDTGRRSQHNFPFERNKSRLR